ncbi:MAG TPA: hypothetical protein VF733_03120 [Candidatus Saccharimonadales bacterium]
MFGHNNDQQHHDNTLPAPNPDGALTQDDGAVTAPQTADDTAGEYIEDSPVTQPTVTHPDPVAPAAAQDETPAASDSESAAAPEPATAPSTAPAADTPTTTEEPDTDALLDIKQQALQQLTPLVDHLEQTPEDEFRTTMMMIQASDNHALIQKAYAAAQKISDEKARAQALLDIVNEINYFTHNGGNAAA